MALTPERIMELSDRLLRVVGAGYVRPQDADGFARAIESEVRKDDAALIRQMLDALELPGTKTHQMLLQCAVAERAARARLD